MSKTVTECFEVKFVDFLEFFILKNILTHFLEIILDYWTIKIV